MLLHKTKQSSLTLVDSAQILWVNSSTLPPSTLSYSGQVSAVLEPIGGLSVIGVPSDYGVYIPISQAQSFFDTNSCTTIIVKLSNSNQATIDAVSQSITDYFGDQVTVVSSSTALTTMNSVFATIQTFLVGIAAISLLVAGIGIMNIMIVSLLERTREIGVFKSVEYEKPNGFSDFSV